MGENNTAETATLGNGCFWCTEAIFQKVPGVLSVESGYSGGDTENPTYKDICTGTTNHAECLNISFDTTVVSFEQILKVFWETHDPTTLNRQGNDSGTQYRSIIFYHNNEQRDVAQKMKDDLDKNGAFSKPIVTIIEPVQQFYKAEQYHQDYYNQNTAAAYCQFVIRPKLDKFLSKSK
ncbi:MAG: peptide-methionine (S)-S-oxide reductase MsrA [Ferruginibacter sp.]